MSISDFIGKPFVYGSDGPDSYDCFTLIREIGNEYFSYDLKELDYEENNENLVLEKYIENGSLVKTDKLNVGNIIVFEFSKKRVHLGLITLPGKFLHTTPKTGVVITPLSLLFQRRIKYILRRA